MDMVNKWITNNNINNVKKSKYINNGRSFVTENETSKNDHCLLAYDMKPQSIDMKTTALNLPVYLQVWEIQVVCSHQEANPPQLPTQLKPGPMGRRIHLPGHRCAAFSELPGQCGLRVPRPHRAQRWWQPVILCKWTKSLHGRQLQTLRLLALCYCLHSESNSMPEVTVK